MAVSTIKKTFLWRGSGASGETTGSETRFVSASGISGLPTRDEVLEHEDRFYWNYAGNWFIREPIYEISQGGLSLGTPFTGDTGDAEKGYIYELSTRVPSGEDIAIFERYTVEGVEYPLSPCVIGGYHLGEWVGAGGTGTDITGNLKTLVINESYSRADLGTGDVYPGYVFGVWSGTENAINEGGINWGGLKLRSDSTFLNAMHRDVRTEELHGTYLTINGSAPHTLKGISLNSYINRMNNYEYYSDEYLEEKQRGYVNNRKYIIEGDISQSLEFIPQRIDMFSQTVFNINNGGYGAITLDNLLFSPNYVRGDFGGIFYDLTATNVNIKAFDKAESAYQNNEVYGAYPAFLSTIPKETYIENLTVGELNDLYNIQAESKKPFVGFGLNASIDNIFAVGGEIAVGGNASDFYGCDIDIETAVLNGGELNLLTANSLNHNILLGVSGTTSPFSGALSYNNEVPVTFPNGSLLKVFSGNSGASGGITSGGSSSVISTSSESMRNLLADNKLGLDLSGQGV